MTIKVFKRSGHLIALANGLRSDIADIACYQGINAAAILAISNGDDMSRIAALLENSELKSHISERFPLKIFLMLTCSWKMEM